MRPRENPYRVARLDMLPFRGPLGEAGDPIVVAVRERLRLTTGRGALIGPHGTGKSTLLRALGALLQRDGLAGAPLTVHHIALRREGRRLTYDAWPCLSRLDARDALLVDGADLLVWPRWLALRFAARRVGVLLVTSHARKLLPPVHHTRTTPALLASLVSELLGSECAAPPSAATLAPLLTEHDGNVRDALRELYDRSALSAP